MVNVSLVNVSYEWRSTYGAFARLKFYKIVKVIWLNAVPAATGAPLNFGAVAYLANEPALLLVVITGIISC